MARFAEITSGRVVPDDVTVCLQFEEDGARGCILFIYSVVLSRTIPRWDRVLLSSTHSMSIFASFMQLLVLSLLLLL